MHANLIFGCCLSKDALLLSLLMILALLPLPVELSKYWSSLGIYWADGPKGGAFIALQIFSIILDCSKLRKALHVILLEQCFSTLP